MKHFIKVETFVPRIKVNLAILDAHQHDGAIKFHVPMSSPNQVQTTVFELVVSPFCGV